jgi:S1-C subfamily serine protease
MTRILILLAGLLLVGNAYALPPCPTGVFHNCYGTYNYSSGSKYVGEWKNGKMHGRGTYLAFTGSRKYVGEWKDNKMHGRGTYTWSNGLRYVGGFEDNVVRGGGTLTYTDGLKYVGEFQDDSMNKTNDPGLLSNPMLVSTNGIKYLASGEVAGTYWNGKRCYRCKPTAEQLAIVRTIESGKMVTAPQKPALTVAPQKPALTVKSNPTNANVYIDGSYKGKTELKIQLTPDHYSIRVSKNGYKSIRREIKLHKDMVVWASLSKTKEVKSKAKESKPKPKPESGVKLIGTGTGFVVNKYYVVTAEHVLENCNAITVRHGHQEIGAQKAARDASNDLGLIRLQNPIGNTAKLRGGKRIRLGEKVANYGYPLFGQLSTSATITEGNINNLSGAGNDSTVLQFDAPTQPGNSGGPLLDSSGNVVGVAIKILSKKYADATGHIAQNVNFAVKSNIVENFLQSNNIAFQTAASTEKLELPDIAEKAETFTVLVGCWE